MPRLVTGLWQVADLEREGGLGLSVPSAVADLQFASDLGLTAFDMADHYGSAEELMAHCPHATAFTKWVPKPGAEYAGGDAADAAVRTALSRMDRQKLDLLQLHTWDYLDGPGNFLQQLRHLAEHPAVSNVGVTNFDTEHLHLALACGLPVVTNQICCSLLDRRFLGRMSELCCAARQADRGAHARRPKILAFGVLAGGLLTDRYLGRGPPAETELAGSWSLAKYYRFVTTAGGWDNLQHLLRALRSIADRHGVSVANVATRWVLDQPAVGAAIVGARLGHAEHVRDNLRVFEFALTAEDRASIVAALALLAPIPGDCGDEYRRPPFLTASGDLSHHLSEVPLAFTAAPLRGHSREVPHLAISTGSRGEEEGCFARAVLRGRRIFVSGTTAAGLGQAWLAQADVVAQMTFALDVVEAALKALGAGLEDVVRVRLYVRDFVADLPAALAAHGLRFERTGEPGLAFTAVQSALSPPLCRVMVECDAEI